MSSLWTPDGEHKVPRPDLSGPEVHSSPLPGEPAPRSTRSAATSSDYGAEGAGEQPSEEELRELARELAKAPVEDVIANHCYGLFELAALHLSNRPVDLAAARLAIDAMGELVEGLGSRLGPHGAALADGLAQIRLAFVRIADATSTATTATAGSGNGTLTADRGSEA
ncbi:MAG: hypothetical protein ACYCST_10420 [Acidimicrobiales bacterium]